MLNDVLFFLTGKELVLYNKHRQSIPVVENERNQRKFFFLSASLFWRVIPFKATNKTKYRIMWLILNFLRPKIILDINWISPYHMLYKAWTNRNRNSVFAVLQHGSYIGGIVTDKAHRYTNCDVFLTWGSYFTELFQNLNSGKRVKITTFGNPVFNDHDRSHFRYSDERNNSILLAPSVITGRRLSSLFSLFEYLTTLGYRVRLKEHKLQSKLGEVISNMPKETAGIFDLLSKKPYDIIITDHSSVLLDAIFFRNRVLIFSDPDGVEPFGKNLFTQSLGNLYEDFMQNKLGEDLYERVNLEKQELLFEGLVRSSNNDLSLL